MAEMINSRIYSFVYE